MDLLRAIKTRRSIRRFLDQDIPRPIINQIIEAGTWAPSNCNLQGWHFIILTNKILKKRLVIEAGSNLRITKAPLVLIACYDQFDAQTSLQSVSAAIQNMLLMATSLGVGSCWLASCGDRQKVKAILNIPKKINLGSMIVFGYPSYQIKFPPPRKPLSKITHWNKFNLNSKLDLPLNPDNWTLEEISNYQYYYCRKTALGVSMDVYSPHETDLIKKTLLTLPVPILDLFTYDGSFIEFFKPKTFTLDLNEQTKMYTQAAANKNHQLINSLIYQNKIPLQKESLASVTCFFKIERIPQEDYIKIFSQVYATLKPGGKLVIIARNSTSLYSLIYQFIKLRFGSDTRHSAIYSFFGPYKPLNVKRLKPILHKIGFNLKISKYFSLPPQLENLYQLYLQYKVSAGTTFLNRVKKQNLISRWLNNLTGLKIFYSNYFGSISIIEAQKPIQ